MVLGTVWVRAADRGRVVGLSHDCSLIHAGLLPLRGEERVCVVCSALLWWVLLVWVFLLLLEEVVLLLTRAYDPLLLIYHQLNLHLVQQTSVLIQLLHDLVAQTCVPLPITNVDGLAFEGQCGLLGCSSLTLWLVECHLNRS